MGPCNKQIERRRERKRGTAGEGEREVAKLGTSASFVWGDLYGQFQGICNPKPDIDCQFQSLGNSKPGMTSDMAG